VPFAEQGKRKEFDDEPFEPPRIEENAVDEQQGIERKDSICGNEDARCAKRSAEQFHFHGYGKDACCTHKKDDHGHNDDIEQLVQKGSDEHDCGALSRIHAFFIQNEKRHGSATLHRWRNGRGEFPKHDDIKAFPPRYGAVGEQSDAIHVGSIAQQHHQ